MQCLLLQSFCRWLSRDLKNWNQMVESQSVMFSSKTDHAVSITLNSSAPRTEQKTISAANFSKTASRIRKYLTKCGSFWLSGQCFFIFFSIRSTWMCRSENKEWSRRLGVDGLRVFNWTSAIISKNLKQINTLNRWLWYTLVFIAIQQCEIIF